MCKFCDATNQPLYIIFAKDKQRFQIISYNLGLLAEFVTHPCAKQYIESRLNKENQPTLGNFENTIKEAEKTEKWALSDAFYFALRHKKG